MMTDKDFIKFVLGIFVISLASLTFEMALSHEYAYMFLFAVSFIVITIAMFGLGIGGVMVHFQIKKSLEKYSSLMYRAFMGLRISMPLATNKDFSYVMSAGSALYLLAFVMIIALHRMVRM